MPFKTSITIPISTSASDPTEVSWRLGFGVITQWWILFRPGNPELAQVQIFHRLVQIIPQSPGEWLTADNYVFAIQDHHELFDKPFELTVKGHNLDVAFPHTVLLHAQVLPPVKPRPQMFLQRLFNQIAPKGGV